MDTKGHPRVDNIDGFRVLGGAINFSVWGVFSLDLSYFFLQEVRMILQERVVTKMMLLWIKDWDGFQLVMRLWRRGGI